MMPRKRYSSRKAGSKASIKRHTASSPRCCISSMFSNSDCRTSTNFFAVSAKLPSNGICCIRWVSTDTTGRALRPKTILCMMNVGSRRVGFPQK